MFFIQAIILLASGLAFSAAFPPVGVWWLAVALVPLFVFSARAEKTRDAFGFGFWFGLGFFALHIFWLPSSLSSPDLFGPLAWVIYPPIVLIEGVFWGLVTGLSHLIAGRSRGVLWVLPAFWLIMEWARTQGPLAFPWGSLGYIWEPIPLVQLADIAGSYGLSFLLLVMVSLLAAPFVPSDEPDFLYTESNTSPLLRFTPVLLVFIMSLASYAYGLYRLTQFPPEPNQTAMLVQGNTDPLGRTAGESDLEVYTHLTSSSLANLAQSPDLVIWPEGAIIGEYVVGMQGEDTRQAVADSAPGITVVSGASIWEDSSHRYNAVISLEDANIRARYDKRNLVPFGEAVPFSGIFGSFYNLIYRNFGIYTPITTVGDHYNPLVTPVATIGTYICYESVFPQVARTMVKEGANVLANISNDAWFGVGPGAEQHFQMGNMRAIETRRYILRDGNDGITAVISPQGKVLERLERGIRGTLEADYALNNTLTPYVRFGDWLIWVVAIYGVLASVFLLLRR